MTNSTVTFRKTLISRASYFALTLSILTVVATTATAQRSITDGSTPLALAPGAPAGSYAQSELETINAYSGSLSFRLPLLQIGGRGSAGYTLSLPIQTHWRTVHKSNEQQMIELPVSNWWSFHRHGYGAGQLEGRVGIDPDHPCIPFHTSTFLSRLTFTAPDGTEYELRDQLTGGQPQSYSCGTSVPYPSRGTVFVTTDGTAATFISDTTLRDDSSMINPTGYLSLRDGTRYRIVNGDVSWLRDRNGNLLTFAYGDKQMTVTDALNRQVVVRYADFPANRFYDEITYKGFGGAQRTIRVNYAPLQSVLRTNRPGDMQSVQTAAALFPELTGSASTLSNPYVTSSVVLPDGVQRYQFLYNVYGELARVTLPTGGAYEYDFGKGSEGDETGVLVSGSSLPEIYRRVLRRRVYSDQGSNLESLTTYSRPELETSGYVEINHFKADQTTLLARARHYFHGTASASFSLGPLDYSSWRDGKEYKTEYYAANGSTLLKSVLQIWDQRSVVWWRGNAETAPPNNAYVKETITTLADTNLVTKTTHINPQNGQTMIDQFNNITDTWVYDYGQEAPGALLNHTHADYLTVNDGIDYSNRTSLASPHLLSLVTRQSIYDASEIEKARTTFEYDNYAATDNFHAAIKDWPALTGVPITGLHSSFTSSYPFRGNVTATTRHLLSGSQTQPITAFAQYDIAGNAVRSIDARSTPANIAATTISFNDCFGTPDGEARANTAPVNLAAVQQRTYAFPTSTTNALGHQTYTQFDYYLGRPVNVEDANGTVYSAAYNDPFERPTRVIRAANRDIAFQSLTSFAYDDGGHSITTTNDLRTFGDQVLANQLLYDGLGRTIETRQFEGNGNFIAQRSVYDALNRVAQASNPFRPWKNETPIWNTTVFDGLGRAESSTTADGASSTISYSGNEVVTTDQAGKKSKSVTNALGRLAKVYEDPNGFNWLTSYAYDALGNLTTVTQDSQTRSFQYDALGRLTSANNPESGLKTYTYDNNGNLITETDARGVVATTAYDALNRPVSKTYQNDPANTPAVRFYYDAQELPAGAPTAFSRGSSTGQLVAATYGVDQGSGDYRGYDLIGRAVLKIQRTGGVNYQVAATYNSASRVNSIAYPSGHVVNYNYDDAGRLGDRDTQNPAMKGNLGDGVSRTYASGITYSNRNALSQEKLGTDTPVYNKLFYNSRGQLAEIRESTMPDNTNWNRGAIINNYSDKCWGMCGGANSIASMTDNNGNLKRQDVYIPNNEQVSSFNTWADSFLYDNLNRLTQVHEYADNISLDWQQEYLYDRWGNRRINQAATYGPNIPKPVFTVDSNNRLAAPAGFALGYDASGNLTNDTYTGQGQRVYDAENRMTKAWSNSQWQTYAYDAAGQRIKRSVSGTETWQVYGLAGELLAEYAAGSSAATAQKEYGYRNGQLLIAAEPASSGGPTNFALAANGGTVTASSALSGYPTSKVNDGDRKGGDPFFWADSTPENFPDWVQIDFNGSKTIGEIDVFTLQDNISAPIEPTLTQTCSTYGNTAFDVQYWNGSSWITVPNGNVVGNNKVWRQFIFTPITTSKIRVVVNAVPDNNFSRVVELEAWSGTVTSVTSVTTNVALAANGGTITASSALSGYATSRVNDGNRKGGDPFFWADATPGNFPDWVQVDFNGSKTIGEIDVFTLQDNISAPIEPTLTQTCSTYGNTAFDVQYWNGSGWTTVPNGNVVGNNKVWRQFIFSPITTSKIRVVVNAVPDNNFSRVVELEAWSASPSVTTNAALAANGGTITASSALSGYSTTRVNDGNRKGGDPFFWADATPGNFPDWVQVDFNGSKTIGEIDVFTLQDNISAPIEPTLTQTCSTYGNTAFDVQYWNGSSWITVPNGNVVGNNKVWRQFIFSPITTSKIRVVVNAVPDNNFSRVVELEAWTTSSSGSSQAANINWLVADQLGTPRMIFDKSGSLASMKRHDYLPFGEEVAAGTGTRTLSQGYGLSDDMRQKFTGKERDNETGMDYFLARHFHSSQGRFISPDPLLASGRPANPQSWNRYSYVLNNPLRFVDPKGLAANESSTYVDFQQPNSPQQPQPTPSPAPPPPSQQSTTDAPEFTPIPVTDFVFCTVFPNQPSSILEVDAPVNAIMNGGITWMANNDLSAMSTLTEMQLHPGTGGSFALSLSVQVSPSPGITWTANKTFYVHSPEEVLLQTGIVNRNIQGSIAAALIPTESMVAGCERRRLGDVRSTTGNMAASFAEMARDEAQRVALTTYQTRYNANPPPQHLPR